MGETVQRDWLRLNRDIDATKAVTAMAPNQATAVQPLRPTGVPMSSARTVSTIGVTGWLSANPCRTAGMVSGGTKALLT